MDCSCKSCYDKLLRAIKKIVTDTLDKSEYEDVPLFICDALNEIEDLCDKALE